MNGSSEFGDGSGSDRAGGGAARQPRVGHAGRALFASPDGGAARQRYAEQREAETASLYKPANPNMAWQLGAIARVASVARSENPYSYPGSRWEWDAGWDYENREIEAGR